MIKEFALSLSKRHYFQDNSKLPDWQGLNSDTYMSLYDYDDDVKDFYAKHNSLSGFDGNIYIPDEFILDIDGANVESARDKTVGLLLFLNDLDVPYRIYFSGTGFHVGIPPDAFRWKPSANLHTYVKDALTKAGVFEYADPSVTDKTRLIRIVNTKNLKSGLYKVQITEPMLQDVPAILKYAVMPKKLVDNIMECNPVFDALVEEKPKEKVTTLVIKNDGRQPDPVNYPCISAMLESNPVGERHGVALRLAAWLRWLYPEEYVIAVMEHWRQKVDTPNNKFSVTEMESIIKSSYEGHGGQGNRWGCNDAIMDKYCKNTCRLFKAKKSTTVMNPNEMDNVLTEFYNQQESNPIDIGKLYGKEFPIHPGEVVLLQAPPASMKTMLMQNWMTGFKRPTYFIEMEMSPRQVWSRFVMMENHWNEESLVNHYSNRKNGMATKFDWLTVDFSPCYAYELEKRIQMLPRKPEVVFVDHIGLFRSKQKDPNAKVEEASQALMELAINSNIVVIAVTEITKSAYYEGTNMASAKGSFRLAYNANKILSLKPFTNKSTGLIEMLDLKCDKNREKETLHVQLAVNNTNIGLM